MAQDVDAFAARLRRIMSFGELRAAFVDFFAGEGVQMMSYHHMPPPGASDYSPTITVAASGFPDDWVELYVKRRLYEIDPIPKHALCTAHPFWWSSIRDAPDLTADERDYLDLLARTDIGDGVAAPLFGPHGRNGYAGLGCGKGEPRWSDEKVARLHWIAQLGHLQYCEILHARAPKDIKLSKREAEILAWVARGKSNSVIADIIGISPNTVDTYLRRLFEKLDVSDRVTAALRGLAIGLVA